jgi:hypothetical protein
MRLAQIVMEKRGAGALRISSLHLNTVSTPSRPILSSAAAGRVS